MHLSLIKLFALVAVIAALSGLATNVSAQSTNTNKAAMEKKSSDKKDSADKKQTAGPFHGKLASLDKSAKTITVGKRTFRVTPDTKITKNGKAATIEDGVVAEEISGYFKTAEDGKLVATKVTFGQKVDGKAAAAAAEKKKQH